MEPNQIPINGHANLAAELSNAEIVKTIAEVEASIKEAEPKADMIFLEAASLIPGDDKRSIRNTSVKVPISSTGCLG